MGEDYEVSPVYCTCRLKYSTIYLCTLLSHVGDHSVRSDLFFCFIYSSGVLTAATEAVRTGRPVERKSTYSAPWILDPEILKIPTDKRIEKENTNDISFLCVPNTCIQGNIANEICCFVFVKYSSLLVNGFPRDEKVISNRKYFLLFMRIYFLCVYVVISSLY